MNATHLDILRTYASIRRGERPGWEGDRVLNAEFYVRRESGRLGDAAALALAADLEENVTAYSDEVGVPPSRIRWIASEVRRCVTNGLGARLAGETK